MSRTCHALIGLARAHALMAEYWYVPGSYTFPKAKAAIVRALEIAPSSAEARATLANILLFCDWNWAEAEREIETAIGLRTKSTSVYTNAAWFFMCKGTGEKPLREMQRALLRRAVLACIAALHGQDVSAHGQTTGARSTRSRTSLRAVPTFQSRDAIARKRSFSTGSRRRRLPICSSYRRIGRRTSRCGFRCSAALTPIAATASAPKRSMPRSLELARTEYVVEFNLATVAVGLGMLDGALAHLERGLQKREPAMLMLRSLPWFEPIEQRARFKALLQAIWPPERPAAPQTTPAYSRTAKGYTTGLRRPLASTLRTPSI